MKYCLNKTLPSAPIETSFTPLLVMKSKALLTLAILWKRIFPLSGLGNLSPGRNKSIKINQNQSMYSTIYSTNSTWNNFQEKHEFEAIPEVVLDVLDLCPCLPQVGVTPGCESLGENRVEIGGEIDKKREWEKGRQREKGGGKKMGLELAINKWIFSLKHTERDWASLTMTGRDQQTPNGTLGPHR